MHSFWFIESERSFLQAAALDPNMAMAYWGISVSAAGDYRPAFQLLRDPYDGGRQAAEPPAAPEAIQRTSNGAAVSGVIRARESIAKAMAHARQRHAARAPLHRSRVRPAQSRVEEPDRRSSRGAAHARRCVSLTTSKPNRSSVSPCSTATTRSRDSRAPTPKKASAC